MQVKTILNRIQKFKSFVYAGVRGAEYAGKPALPVEVEARTNSRALCSLCGQVSTIARKHDNPSEITGNSLTSMPV